MDAITARGIAASAAERRSVAVFIRVTAEEREQLKDAARAERMSLSAWCRSALLREVESTLGRSAAP